MQYEYRYILVYTIQVSDTYYQYQKVPVYPVQVCYFVLVLVLFEYVLYM